MPSLHSRVDLQTEEVLQLSHHSDVDALAVLLLDGKVNVLLFTRKQIERLVISNPYDGTRCTVLAPLPNRVGAAVGVGTKVYFAMGKTLHCLSAADWQVRRMLLRQERCNQWEGDITVLFT